MTLDPLTRARLVALFILGVLLLNYPILSLTGEGRFVFGVPSLVAYCFLAWAGLILLIGLAVRSTARQSSSSSQSGPSQPIDS